MTFTGYIEKLVAYWRVEWTSITAPPRDVQPLLHGVAPWHEFFHHASGAPFWALVGGVCAVGLVVVRHGGFG